MSPNQEYIKGVRPFEEINTCPRQRHANDPHKAYTAFFISHVVLLGSCHTVEATLNGPRRARN